MPFARTTLANVQLAGRPWEEVRAELQRFLESLNDTQDDDVLAPGVDPDPSAPPLSFSPIGGTFSPYPVAAGDDIILVDALGGSVTILLPTASSNAGRLLRVKKIDVTNNVVTLDGSGSGALIDGDATFDLEVKDESVDVACDGTDWWIL